VAVEATARHISKISEVEKLRELRLF